MLNNVFNPLHTVPKTTEAGVYGECVCYTTSNPIQWVNNNILEPLHTTQLIGRTTLHLTSSHASRHYTLHKQIAEPRG